MLNSDENQGEGRRVFAATLRVVGLGGLLLSAAAFALYAAGALPPFLALSETMALWSQPAADFAALSGMPAGLAWLGRLDRGEALALSGLTLLCFSGIPPFLALAVSLFRRKKFLYGLLALAQIIVFIFAAISTLFGL